MLPKYIFLANKTVWFLVFVVVFFSANECTYIGKATLDIAQWEKYLNNRRLLCITEDVSFMWGAYYKSLNQKICI